MIGGRMLLGMAAATLACSVLASRAAPSPLSAQAMHLTPATLFSQDQAAAGGALFAQKCASCHGGAPEANEFGPALYGDEFWDVWGGRPTRRLYSRIISTMPGDAPGTLAPAEALALTAYVATGGVADGKGVSDPDALNAVPMTKPAS